MKQFRPNLRDHEITEQQWRVVRALYGLDGVGITPLAEKTLLLMPSLTRILQTLEKNKIVRRLAVENDNRKSEIQLTELGNELYLKIAPLAEAEYLAIEARIGKDNLESLYALLDKI